MSTDLTLELTSDGSPTLRSARFGECYHSRHGAWQDMQHVFIDAGLRALSQNRTHLAIVEYGYGTGLNCLATLLAAHELGYDVAYTALEAYPLDSSTLASLQLSDRLNLSNSERAAATWMQAVPFDEPPQTYSIGANTLTLEKRTLRFEDFDADAAFDLIYFDAFAPEAQPELWTPAIFATAYNALLVGGCLVTYCAKGQVKRNMRAAGFQVERLPGPPGKREMTRAWRR